MVFFWQYAIKMQISIQPSRMSYFTLFAKKVLHYLGISGLFQLGRRPMCYKYKIPLSPITYFFPFWVAIKIGLRKWLNVSW